MSLWAWVAEFPVKPVATAATAATEQGEEGELSQQSQQSQGEGGNQRGREASDLSQVSQLSQRFEDAGARGSDDHREAFEERAAIMEFDGGMTRVEAEHAARECRLRFDALAEAAADRETTLRRLLDDWGDLRPCTWCRSLSPGGRCLAAWRGELRAARDYSPTFPDHPRRCIGYRPRADDPDRTSGRERWPELVVWQGRGNEAGQPEGRAHG
jgi:hypothetical protein